MLGIRGGLAAIGLVAPVVVALFWRRLRTIDASITHRDEEIEVLREVGMLRPLPMPAIENLAVHVGHVNVDEGREVFRQGDSGDTFYVIKDGKAEIIDHDRHVSTIGPGTASARSLSSATVRAPPRCARVPGFCSTRSSDDTSWPRCRATLRARARPISSSTIGSTCSRRPAASAACASTDTGLPADKRAARVASGLITRL